MKYILRFLIGIGILLLIFPVVSKAQQKITFPPGVPVITTSKDGSYMICIEGLAGKKEADKLIASLNKSGVKTISNSGSKVKVGNKNSNPSGPNKGTVVRKVAGIDYNGKLIHYGPWRMLNKMSTPSYADEVNFDYGSNGKNRESGGGGTGSKVIVKKVNPDLTSILKLNPQAQLSVIQGQRFSVQVGEFKFDKNATAAMQKISGATTLPVIVVIKSGLYYLVIEGFSSWDEAKAFVATLDTMGFKGLIVKSNSTMK